MNDYPIVRGGYDQGAHPAGMAAEFGHVEILAYFAERGFDVNSKFRDGETDVFLSGLLGRHFEVLQYLLQQGYHLDCGFRFRNGRNYAELANAIGFDDGARLVRDRCEK